jgi:hypothetical protein
MASEHVYGEEETGLMTALAYAKVFVKVLALQTG